MSLQSPDVVLYDGYGIVMPVQNGTAIPAGTSGLLFAGSDGTIARNISTDTSGRLIMVGSTAAGAGSAVNLVTIQGNAGATAVPVSFPAASSLTVDGYVTTSAPAYSANTTQALSLDTTGNLRILANQPTAANLNATVIGLGTSGAVLVSQATAANLNATIIGTATDNTANVTTKLPAIVAVANTLTPLATATDMISLSVTTGTAGNGGGGLLRIDSVYPIGTANTVALDSAQSGGLATTSAPSYTNNQVNPLSLDLAGNLRVLVAGSAAAGAGSSTNVVTVQGNSSGTPIPVSGSLTVDKSSTGTITSVAGNTSSVTLLASNANRISASIFNGTNKTLYVAMAATATTSAYTVQIAINAYYELSISYTGIITGISPASVSGNVLITEYT